MAIFPIVCTRSPDVDLPFIALWISVFSFNQLNNDSMGCLTLEIAVDNKALAAFSLLVISNDSPFPHILFWILWSHFHPQRKVWAFQEKYSSFSTESHCMESMSGFILLIHWFSKEIRKLINEIINWIITF